MTKKTEKVEEVVIDAERFENLRKMIESSNTDDAIVALHVMENCDFKNSIGPALYLYKLCKFDPKLWKEHAPNFCKKAEKLQIKIGEELTFAHLMKILYKNNCDPFHANFVCRKIGDVVKEQFVEWGLEFIESIEVNVIPKKNMNV
jgi:hypothetical protein